MKTLLTTIVLLILQNFHAQEIINEVVSDSVNLKTVLQENKNKENKIIMDKKLADEALNDADNAEKKAKKELRIAKKRKE